ncbi:putative SURF1-like protein [Frondihabitans sp. 762G35]|uniref:SURF1 family cytochrome oxidase biogenesis protein n=1 Tax=Frondihabitans sp. 762G35 TaxID=1446794 RepID=UPI000D215051|nr:SURF1 family protein [Frondihabitans sp. 762G35]ARC56856.1 putative SURF1-like protein [Frondihabitans sp. 762G35]
MKEWRFALSRKWLGYFAVAVVFAIVCAFLAHWQWQRRAENLALLDRLNANYSAQPVALTSILPELSSYSDADEYRPVKVTGTYLVDKTFLARDRSYNGFPGFEVLVPLQTASGDVFIVDRGWVPTGNRQDAPDSIPAPPSGTVTVVARLAPAEPTVPGRTDIPGTNQLAVIKPGDIASRIQLPTYTAAFGQLRSESPKAADLPKLAQKPQVDYGLNLSYAIQWILFALAAFAFFGYVIRQEYDAIHSDEEDQRWLEEARAYRRSRRGPDDAEIEDDLLDEVGYEGSEPGTRIGR